MRHIVSSARIAVAASLLLAFTALSCNTAPQISTPGATLLIQRLVGLNAAGVESDVLEIEVGSSIPPDAAGVATVVNPAGEETADHVVILSRYRVTWIRDDGKARVGLDVPYPFDATLDAVVGPSAVVPIRMRLVRAIAFTEPPLVQLAQGNETVDLRGTLVVTLFGRDLSGTSVSVTGRIPVHVFHRG
ncbi:MAG: hypothetical protein HYX75_24535 [Acidobacteria bacterium]|nr:hypothetical protein [Acidobacteriota bacterium]